MSGDVVSLAAEVTPYVSAAVGAYGGAVLARVRDDAAEAAVSLGRRLLVRIFGRRETGEQIPEPLAALAADPGDGEALAAVLIAVRRAFAADPELAAEVRSMLAGARSVSQRVRAERDAYTGVNQTVINQYGPAAERPQAYGLARQVWGDVPARNPGFVGRESLLVAVREALLAGDRAVVQALHRMGGVGNPKPRANTSDRYQVRTSGAEGCGS